MVSKSQWTLNLLRHNLYDRSQSTKELGYKTLVRPSLAYASCVWDPFQTNHIRRLEAVLVKWQDLSLVSTGGKPMWQPSWTISSTGGHQRWAQSTRKTGNMYIGNRQYLNFLRIQALDYLFWLFWMCGLIWVISYFWTLFFLCFYPCTTSAP